MAAPDKIPGSLTVTGVERQLEHFLRLGQPAHIRIARRQNPIGREKTRQLLQ